MVYTVPVKFKLYFAENCKRSNLPATPFSNSRPARISSIPIVNGLSGEKRRFTEILHANLFTSYPDIEGSLSTVIPEMLILDLNLLLGKIK